MEQEAEAQQGAGLVSKRPRVLLIAELANPDWVSVPLEGWAHSQALAAVADTHLVTHVRNRENILKAGLSAEEFTTFDTGTIEQPISRLLRVFGRGAGVGQTTMTAFYSLHYPQFESLVWKHFGDSVRGGKFDIVHRLTPLSPTVPSPIARHCAEAGVPFVLGPLNGGLPWPSGFDSVRRKENEWLSYVRDGYRVLPGYRATRRHAAAIICGSCDTRQQLSARYQDRSVYIPENAIEPARFDRFVEGEVTLPLKAVFVGRLVPYKGADALIEAAAPLIRAGQMQLEIIGDGPEMPTLQSLAQRERLGEGITFAGWVKHQELKDRLIQSHVFAFPSIREFGGAVVLEAMALGLVPVVVGYGGPGELVSPLTGYAIQIGTREQLIERFQRTFAGMVREPSLIRPMGRRARERVFRDFTWAAKARQVLEVYRWVLGQRDRPDFGMPLPDPD